MAISTVGGQLQPPAQPRGRFAIVAAERPRVVLTNRHVLHVWPDCVRLRYWDGAERWELVAAPQATAEYAATARALGYQGATPTVDMNAAHDLYHVICAQALGAATSPVVRAIATGTLDRLEQWQIAGEEATVAAFTRFVQMGCRAPELAPLAVAHGPDYLEHVRRDLLDLWRFTTQSTPPAKVEEGGFGL